MELKKYKLADIGKVITGKTPSTSIAENYACGTIPFYTPEDVAKGLGMMGRNNRFITQTGFEEISSNTITGESVLVGCIGSDMGNVAYSNITCATNQQINSITQFVNGVEPLYVYYLLSTMKPYFQKIAGSTTTPILPKSVFEEIEIHLPNINIQKDVVSILYALDHKIELNKQINDNLEAMAKQLYDYWFVQFDFPNDEGKPYKSSGGAMVWNDNLKREIPQGWNDCKIKDFMRIFTGKKDVSKAVPGNYKFFSCAPEPISSNEYIYDGYAVLVSGNGSYTGRVGFYKGKFDLYQRTYACVLDKDEHNISFFYYTLRYLFQPIYSGGKHGSSIPYIVLGDLADFRFAFNETICTKFVDAAKPMFDEQLLRQKEIEALTKQRDELLPLLMNGQVSVNSD